MLLTTQVALLVVVLILSVSHCCNGKLRIFTLVISDGWGAPDGYERAVIRFNNSIPGPELHVDEGDTIEITLHNRMMERVASLHVHGLLFSSQPWQDGVSMITQCPVLPGTQWKYRFVVQNKAGSYWYHSHVAGQVGDGAFGAFVIHPQKPEISAVALDKFLSVTGWWWRDQHSLLSQWNAFSQGLSPASHDHLYFMEMTSVLFNGKARSSKCVKCPLEVIQAVSGQRIRLRLLSSCSPVPFRITVHSHKMTIVARDGKDTEPLEVSSLMLDTGQRLDVIVNLDQPIGSYWISAVAVHIHGKMNSDHHGMAMHGVSGKTGEKRRWLFGSESYYHSRRVCNLEIQRRS
jgi:iron transport multicopper oxidase